MAAVKQSGSSEKMCRMYSSTTSRRPNEAMPTRAPAALAALTIARKKSRSATSRSHRSATSSTRTPRPKAWMRSTVLSKSHTTSVVGCVGAASSRSTRAGMSTRSFAVFWRVRWPRVAACILVALSTDSFRSRLALRPRCDAATLVAAASCSSSVACRRRRPEEEPERCRLGESSAEDCSRGELTVAGSLVGTGESLPLLLRFLSKYSTRSLSRRPFVRVITLSSGELPLVRDGSEGRRAGRVA